MVEYVLTYCYLLVSPFGEKTKENNYIALKDSILYKNTTLYCVTEVQSTPQVIWTFLHPSGVNTILPAPTNTTTGVSTLYVTNDKPGIYTCVVSQNGGNTKTYFAVMKDYTQGLAIINDINLS